MDATHETVSRQGRAVRSAALGGVVGPIVFVVLVLVGGGLYDGYSHVTRKISELGGEGAEYALLQSLNFVVVGVLIMGFAWALARYSGPPYLGPALIGFFGLSSGVGNGLFPCDLGCEGVTTVGLLHNVTGLAGFVAAMAGMFVLQRRWRSDPRWQSHIRFTRIALIVASVGLAWFVVTSALDSTVLVGVAQRVYVGALLAWTVVTAARLYREIAMESLEPRHGAALPSASNK